MRFPLNEIGVNGEINILYIHQLFEVCMLDVEQ